MVSPEGFDELFQKEARVIEFVSSAEEAEYEKRDSQLITRIRQAGNCLLTMNGGLTTLGVLRWE